jgi:16S rRNA (uracil1498-N3)-methyltransferase
MRLNRFLMKFNADQDNLRIDNFEIYNQIRNVLRLKPGEQIILFDGNLNEAQAEILNIDSENKTIDTILIKKTKIDRASDKEVILYCSILKRENFELVVQKVTEIGISKIVPIICERTIKTEIRKERLEKIIKEASEQSGRITVPELKDAISFDQAIESAKENDSNLLFDISGELVKSYETNPHKIGLFIGPEGGWSEEELELAKSSNFKTIRLSELTFRAETAAIIASYLTIACEN